MASSFVRNHFVMLGFVALSGCSPEPSGNDAGASGGRASAGGMSGGGVAGGSSGGTGGSGGGTGTTASAARGEYLVRKLLRCGSCHGSSADPSILSGGRSFAGTLADGGLLADGGVPQYYATNLTPSDAGINAHSIEDLKTVLRTGRRPDGQVLSPIMPYSIYSALTEADAESVGLYLKTLAPVNTSVPSGTAARPASAPPALMTAGIPASGLPANDPNAAAALEGRYLSILACLDCHTPRDAAGRRQLDRSFAGGRPFGAFLKSSNLTPDRDGGIGTYSVSDFTTVLKTGMRKGTPLCPTMPAGPMGYGQLTEGDLNAIGHYLLSIPPNPGGPYGRANPDGGC